MAEAQASYEVNVVTVGCVVLLLRSGSVSININQAQAQNIFHATLGAGVFQGVQNGFMVSCGHQNKLVFQPPRIQYTATTLSFLEELYKNANATLFGQLRNNGATDFGINHELSVRFKNYTIERILSGLRPRGLNTDTLLDTISFTKPGPAGNRRTTYIIQRNPQVNNGIYINVNHNISSPGTTFYRASELLDKFHEVDELYRIFLEEISVCLQTVN